MKQRMTIRDVAREAGVSHQTVSRVINESSDISPLTRGRVLEAIQKLNYRPSRTARSLAMQRTQTVGLLVPNIANPYFAEIAHGAQQVARAHNYSVFLGNTGWEPQEELQLLYSLASHPVDGIILCSARSSDADLTTFCDYYRPLVLGGRIFEHRNVSLVLRADDQGMQLIIEHLQQKGHTRIGFLAGPVVEPTMSNALMVHEFRRAMQNAGLSLCESWIAPGPLTMEGGYHTARLLLAHHPEITALCAHNDLMAIGAIKACREVGRKVPTDCAVIGYNDVGLAAMYDPPLTTVHVDSFAVGRQQMQRLLDMINHPDEYFPSLITPIDGLIQRGSG